VFSLGGGGASRDLPCEETHTADQSLTIGVGGALIPRPERGHLSILTGVA